MGLSEVWRKGENKSFSTEYFCTNRRKKKNSSICVCQKRSETLRNFNHLRAFWCFFIVKFPERYVPAKLNSKFHCVFYLGKTRLGKKLMQKSWRTKFNNLPSNLFNFWQVCKFRSSSDFQGESVFVPSFEKIWVTSDNEHLFRNKAQVNKIQRLSTKPCLLLTKNRKVLKSAWKYVKFIADSGFWTHTLRPPNHSDTRHKSYSRSQQLSRVELCPSSQFQEKEKIPFTNLKILL